jgi:rare lipoprotein A
MRQAPNTVIAIAAFLTVAILFPSLAAAKEPSNGGAETGIAACYSRRLTGHRTTSGQRYNPNALTAAHATIPLGTHVKVTNIENGKSVVVLVNDHMSAHAGGRIIMDISQRACKELHFGPGGEAKVKLEIATSSTAAASH